MLLKVGRHLRPAANFKVIVSREEGEGKFMQGYRKQYPNLKTTSHGGPLALLDGEPSEQDIELAARIVARYSQGKHEEQVTLDFTDREGNTREMQVKPLAAHEIPKEWIL